MPLSETTPDSDLLSCLRRYIIAEKLVPAGDGLLTILHYCLFRPDTPPIQF
jgi:hypothetical protein